MIDPEQVLNEPLEIGSCINRDPGAPLGKILDKDKIDPLIQRNGISPIMYLETSVDLKKISAQALFSSEGDNDAHDA